MNATTRMTEPGKPGPQPTPAQQAAAAAEARRLLPSETRLDDLRQLIRTAPVRTRMVGRQVSETGQAQYCEIDLAAVERILGERP